MGGMTHEEREFVRRFAELLTSYGCKCFLEERPDGSNKRIDLIANHPKFGYIGFEAKHINTLGQGAVIAKAVEQIQEYRKYTYFNGVKIERWVFLPKFDNLAFESGDRVLEFIRSFLRHYDIYFARVNERTGYWKQDTNKWINETFLEVSIGYGFPNSITLNPYEH